MPEPLKLNRPWLIAAWPGMGAVALNAGVYLLAKLRMKLVAEFEANDLFDIEHVEVKDGIIQSGRRPANRFFLWTDPAEQHDLVVFLGEAQPPLGKHPFCRQLMAYARQHGVERVFTFAAMATQMHPEHDARVFAAATDLEMLEELKGLDLEILESGNISGLNGVLLGAAAENGLRGACLLGEMPHIFSQLPYPKASLAILKVFTRMKDLELDFSELAEQAQLMDQQLVELLSRVEETYGQKEQEDESFGAEPAEEPGLDPVDQQWIERLFEEATQDRSKAFELKRGLDRLGVFKDYEDRFLDLFKK
jgi:uncharacterized protein